MNKALIYQPSRSGVAETTVTNATTSKKKTDKQTRGEMTDDIMYERLSVFFSDEKNIAFSCYNEFGHYDVWYLVLNFNQTIFKTYRDQASGLWHTVYIGAFADDIKKLTKYVKCGGIPTELFPKGGSGYTPVMTKSGLHTFLKRLPKCGKNALERDMAEKNMEHFIARVILMPNEPVDEVLPRPVRQKMVAFQHTFKITEAVSSGASAASALSTVSTMQVRLLV